jgi:hypothetical protein
MGGPWEVEEVKEVKEVNEVKEVKDRKWVTAFHEWLDGGSAASESSISFTSLTSFIC